MTEAAAPPVVLVHGAWHGGWCWKKVRRILASLGMEIHTPTLTGLGERIHLRTERTDLETHVRDILNVLEFEDLRDVVLCGHSYAGMILTALADRAPERLGALVYVDAYVPGDGQSVLDLRPEGHNRVLMERVEREGQGWLMPPTAAASFGVESEEDRAWVDAKCVPMPLACFTQPLSIQGGRDEILPRHYILAERNDNAAFRRHYDEFREDGAWRTHSVDCGHEVMVDRPRWLAERLEQVVAQTRTTGGPTTIRSASGAVNDRT